MNALLDVILPVFVVIGFGYLAVWRGWFAQSGVDGLVKFTQNFAIPCLLFKGILDLDLGVHFDPKVLISFYAGALICFTCGALGARFVFQRTPEEAVAIGFCCLFSNSVLLGLPITERAFGTQALAGNFAIIALHAPFCYGVGVTVMEITRAQAAPKKSVLRNILKAMFSNALIIGITLGAIFNITGASLLVMVDDAVNLMAAASLPAALFGLGGVLYQYRPKGDMRLILGICAISLILHPTLTYVIGSGFELPQAGERSAMMTASMAPGVNAYIFASLYGRAQGIAASAVLIATALSILSVWGWLLVLQ